MHTRYIPHHDNKGDTLTVLYGFIVQSLSCTCLSYTICNMVYLTHCSRVVHIYVNKIITIVSDNGISPVRRKAIIWANAGILCIGTLGMKFRTILIEINIFSFKNLPLKILSAKWCPFRLGLNVLTTTATSRCISIWYIKTLGVQWDPFIMETRAVS